MVVAVLDFVSLLEMAEIDPAHTLIVRHVPVEKSLKRVLPWLVIERPDLWLAYQRIQWESLEKAMTRGRTIASFIGDAAGSAVFAGLYTIGAWERLDAAGYDRFPGNRELMAFGMAGRTTAMPDCLAFELTPHPAYQHWVGHLTIDWPQPYQRWWRWAKPGHFAVRTIEADSRFVPAVPDWREMILSWQELSNLPKAWQAALSQWRGIYLIHDCERGASYVGSAGGSDNIHGRWCDYARSGHGGNRGLKDSKPDQLRFSILERTSPDLSTEGGCTRASSGSIRTDS
jgi:hypothetical protein